MSLINPVWLGSDKHTRALDVAGWYVECADEIDNQIISDCAERGVTIPTDGLTGFIDSAYLRTVAVNYAKYATLVGNRGINDSEKELYYQKSMDYWRQYDKAIKNLCPTLV